MLINHVIGISVLTLGALFDERWGAPAASCISLGLHTRPSWLMLVVGDGDRVADWLFPLDPQVMLRKSGRATGLTDCVRGRGHMIGMLTYALHSLFDWKMMVIITFQILTKEKFQDTFG